MTAKDVTALIVDYLTVPRSERSAIIARLAQTPDWALKTILGFRGPYPSSIDPRDVHGIHLVNLLTELLKRCPSLFVECELKSIDRFARYGLICAAISTHDPQFTDKIIGALRDRSIYIKLLVIDAIVRHDYLRTPQAKHHLERLLSVKSIADSEYDRVRVERALRAFAE